MLWLPLTFSLESKSPLLAHFVETADGVSTIRAYGWAREFNYKAWRLLDACQKPFYLLLCIQQWLTLVLGIMVAVLATLLTALPMGMRGSNAGAGFIGVALVNLMSFGDQLARLLSFWTALETSLGAIARVKIFSEDTPQEESPECDVPEEWPGTGSLVFDDWSAKYAEYVLLRVLLG